MTDEAKTPVLNNTAYDIAKDTVTLYLPALAVFYSAVAGIWGWPFSNEVVGTIAALVTLLGVILKISSNQHQKAVNTFDGAVVVDATDPTKDVYRLELDIPVSELEAKSELRLKVTDDGIGLA